MQCFTARAAPAHGALPCTRASRRNAVAVRAVASADVKTVTLKAQRITKEAFAPFGQVRVASTWARGKSRWKTRALAPIFAPASTISGFGMAS